VPRILTPEKVYSKIKLVNDSLVKDFGIMKPSIAVLGLNPHAGEEGAFGDEEAKIIKPAILKAQRSGINARGPFPPDTIFQKIIKDGSFDAAVCMYHDQGLIPLKLVAFDTGVNVTLGLPIVRTSPDHGTAYDIAGTGQASENSLIAAVKAAVMIAQNRKKSEEDKKVKNVR
jgi:4-hydroxy-L-threonine phosphate dehydrogenase PdxA